ncbi:MAG: hypothetical protein HPY50_18410 [Firmicutes bacterium]|nr:hypothetical protein [Bacillota bacterium]
MKISMVFRFAPIGRIIITLIGLGLFLLLVGIWIGAVALVVAIPLLIKLNTTKKYYDFILTPTGFEYENKEIEWKEIKKVEFSNTDKFSTSKYTKRFYDPVINVQTEDRRLAIITQKYNESRALRDAFVEACREKNIKYKVEDQAS